MKIRDLEQCWLDSGWLIWASRTMVVGDFLEKAWSISLGSFKKKKNYEVAEAV